MGSAGKTWHEEILSTAAEETIKCLSAIGSIQDFYLAGGTGLALHLGHPRSADLDFFSDRLSTKRCFWPAFTR